MFICNGTTVAIYIRGRFLLHYKSRSSFIPEHVRLWVCSAPHCECAVVGVCTELAFFGLSQSGFALFGFRAARTIELFDARSCMLELVHTCSPIDHCKSFSAHLCFISLPLMAWACSPGSCRRQLDTNIHQLGAFRSNRRWGLLFDSMIVYLSLFSLNRKKNVILQLCRRMEKSQPLITNHYIHCPSVTLLTKWHLRIDIYTLNIPWTPRGAPFLAIFLALL